MKKKIFFILLVIAFLLFYINGVVKNFQRAARLEETKKFIDSILVTPEQYMEDLKAKIKAQNEDRIYQLECDELTKLSTMYNLNASLVIVIADVNTEHFSNKMYEDYHNYFNKYMINGDPIMFGSAEYGRKALMEFLNNEAAAFRDAEQSVNYNAFLVCLGENYYDEEWLNKVLNIYK